MSLETWWLPLPLPRPPLPLGCPLMWLLGMGNLLGGSVVFIEGTWGVVAGTKILETLAKGAVVSICVGITSPDGISDSFFCHL